jgi:hypothetical protein
VNDPHDVKPSTHVPVTRSLGTPKLLLIGLTIFLVAVSFALWMKFDAANGAGQRPVLGLMTTLPLQWEEGEIGDIIQSGGVPSPAYSRLNSKFDIRPVDSLASKNIKGADVLLLAQPRAFSSSEFLELDEWIRGGGRLLLLADPALQWESIYPLGDKRRPLFTSLLSPLFKHWGIELVLPVSPEEEKRQVYEIDDLTINTVTSGEWRAQSTVTQNCEIRANARVAECNIGRGKAILLADADLLNAEHWQGSGVRAVAGFDDFDNITWIERQLDKLASAPK